jgi:preprotein translocase subunit SecY
MFETIRNAFKIKEVRSKILYTLLFVLLFRVGCFIQIPGINTAHLAEHFAESSMTMSSILNAITGNALQNGTLFALGISPYINSSIIMQLLTVAIPRLERLSKEGEEGKKKINVITRWLTLALAIVSALGIVFALGGNQAFDTAWLGTMNGVDKFFANNIWIMYVYVIAILVAGSMLCMWIGERITEYGISNGISMIIFVGILSTAASAIFTAIGGGNWVQLAIFLVSVILIFAFIVWVDGAERKLRVQYAKQVKGNKMYGGQSTFIPVKVNASGVMPIIFASSIATFPTMIIQTFAADGKFAQWWNQWMATGTVVYQVVMALLILAFAYFYSQIQFNPIEISKNIQQNGGFIPGIRPGRETSEYLHKVISRITLWGALFLAIIALVPSILFMIPGWLGMGTDTQLISSMSTTGMLIIVSVTLEFHKALENQIMMRHYKGFLK